VRLVHRAAAVLLPLIRVDPYRYASPAEILSDGCSSAGKILERFCRRLGFELEPACKEHDWAGCTRCHPEGELELAGAKAGAAWQLRWRVREALPWWLHYTAGMVFVAVRTAGGYWNSCGPEAGARCRHGQGMPPWMAAKAAAALLALLPLGIPRQSSPVVVETYTTE
jgi:hypothetical protein